jgi:hypothetical protein
MYNFKKNTKTDMNKIVHCFVLILLTCSFYAHGQTCTSYQAANNIPDAGCDTIIWVTSTADTNVPGTLRWAINKSNARTGTGTSVRFCINTPGEIVIQLTSELPAIVKRIVIDGTKNITYTNQQVIVIQGNKSTINYGISLDYGSDNTMIRGLIIRNMKYWGVYIVAYSGSQIISYISILDNIIYDVENSGINVRATIKNITIHRNIFNGYKNSAGTVLPYTLANMNVGINLNGASIIAYPTRSSDINIGSGIEADANKFFISKSVGGISVFLAQLCINPIDRVSIKYNYIYPTNSKNIALGCNVNNNKKKPVITGYTATNKTITGTASPNDRIEVYIGDNYLSNPIIQPAAIKYVGVTYANASGVWNLPYTSWENPSLQITDYDAINAIADSLSYSSEFAIPYIARVCPVTGIIGLPDVACKNGGTYALTGVPAGGTFSSVPAPSISGTTTATLNPAILAAGTYTVTYSGFAVPPALGCSTSVSKQVVIPPPAQILKKVISISAGTYADAWPVDNDVPASNIGYGSYGVKFLWAPDEQYAYVDDRFQTDTLSADTAGLLQHVPMFNWSSTASNACYANWRKVNTITQINSGTGQLENKDILNNYSAALYGYNDQLATAVAANAAYKEIAFESFEEYTAGSTLNLTTISKSNFTLVNAMPNSTNRSKNIYFDYTIEQASGNELYISYPEARLPELMNKRIGVFGASVIDNTNKNIHGYYDIQSAVADASGLIRVILNPADFTFTGPWTGKMTIPFTISPAELPAIFTVPSGSNAIVTAFPGALSRKAHSGKQFLRVNASTEVEQVSMKLTAGKQMVISAWVSTDNADADTYVSGIKQRAIGFEFLNAAGQKINAGTYLFEPTGNIIEGWQRIEGVVTVPTDAVRFTVRFVTPAGTNTYFDDVRIFPFDGNMQSYVYDKNNLRLTTTLDQNNYATYYYYNEEGSVYLVKKETELDVQTIQEVYMHYTEINK